MVIVAFLLGSVVGLLAGGVLAWLLLHGRARGRAGVRAPAPDAWKLLDATLYASADGVLAAGADATVRYANPAALDLLQQQGKDLRGAALVPVLRDHAACEAVARTLHDGLRRQAAWTSPDGTRELSAVIAPLPDGLAWKCVLFIRDVSAARRSEVVRRDFVSNVSHELRTPLASIKAVVEVLEAGVDDEDVRAQFVRNIDQETERMIRLVEELMELTRMESGQVQLRREPIEPGRLLAGVAGRMQAQAERKRIALGVETEDELPAIQGDEERLGRALLNLVQNALNFTPEGGRVTLRATREEGSVRLDVEDTGTGIAAAELPRVFERFYKADRARGSDGSGLGLAIVKHTVEAHGGTVSVRSRLGSGSTFSVALPVPREQPLMQA